jgi:putative solute:sodium symporter small subunit
MNLSDQQRAYWRANLMLTSALLLLWFLVTFVVAYFAAPLNEYTFLGFPLSFYIFSQGALIVFVLIVGFYVWAMNRLDRKYGVAERRRH